MKDTAHRLALALSIAEANSGVGGVEKVREDALERARGYLRWLREELGDGEPWMCARCGTLHPADAGSCRACHEELRAKAPA